MRLLIVEDEQDLLSALAKTCRKEGYAVDTSSDGEEGLYKAKTFVYDAIILDLMLPKLDGRELLRQLRQEKKTPVLILSARDTVPDRVQGLDTGTDDYLVKPFERDELLSRLRALIRRAAGEASPCIVLGEAVVNTAARTVQLAGADVSLTPREYTLLEFLAMHRGSVVTRTTLYEHLFDENEDNLSNLLDVHIWSLRKKLGKDFVVTRRGHGYLIDA